MEEAELRSAAAGVEARDQALELAGAVVEGAVGDADVAVVRVEALVAEAPERGVDRGQPLRERARQQLVQRDDREVLAERGEPLSRGRSREVAAEPVRAEVGRGLVDVAERVGAAQQREQVVRVVGGDRQAVRGREAAAEQPGHGVGGVVGDRGRVAVPGGGLGERGEVGKAGGVDPTLVVHQQLHRELVEHDHHHRRTRADVGAHLHVIVAAEQIRDRRREEQHEEEHGCRGEHREAGAHRLEAVVGDRGAQPAGERQQHQKRRRPVGDALEQLQRQGGGERADEGQV